MLNRAVPEDLANGLSLEIWAQTLSLLRFGVAEKPDLSNL